MNEVGQAEKARKSEEGGRQRHLYSFLSTFPGVPDPTQVQGLNKLGTRRPNPNSSYWFKHAASQEPQHHVRTLGQVLGVQRVLSQDTSRNRSLQWREQLILHFPATGHVDRRMNRFQKAISRCVVHSLPGDSSSHFRQTKFKPFIHMFLTGARCVSETASLEVGG